MPDITFRVQRNDPAAGFSELQDFVVPVQGSLTVLEALFEIQEKQDPSLAFRYCCRSSICGSCSMYINGRYRLACQTNISHLDADTVTVLPLAPRPGHPRPGMGHGRLLRQIRVRQALAHPQLADP